MKSNKYLVLNYKDAKLFRNRNSDDKIFELGNEKKDRRGQPQFVEPITVFHISNMIHSLFGERPVPTLRKCLYPRIEYYFDMAMKSLIKDNTFQRTNKKGELTYVNQTLYTKKAWFNSWNPSPRITWNFLERYVGQEHYPWFIDELIKILGHSPFNVTVIELREILKSIDITNFRDELIKRKLKGFYSYITEANGETNMIRKPETAQTVLGGPEKVIKLHGQIIVPITDKDVETLKQSKGFATILDGGLVWIDSILDGNEINPYGFKKVSDLSTEKK